MRILVFALALRSVAAELCYNASGVLTTSANGTSCVECNLAGFLQSGVCRCYAPGGNAVCVVAQPVAQTVTSACGVGLCTDDDGFCVLSAAGARCMECGYGGYIALNSNPLSAQTYVCQCYSTSADPNDACQMLVPDQYAYTYQDDRTDTVCTFYKDPRLGFYADNFNCLYSFLGPPPNQALLSTECDTYGGPDPVNPRAGFYTCNHHGYWNATSHSCVCDLGWALVNTTLEGVFGGGFVFLCVACEEWYGPPVDQVAFYGQEPVQAFEYEADNNYCAVVWTPDPLDGLYKECSGHGVYQNGACSCFFNATAGFWGLTTLGGTSAVQTCAACVLPYRLPNCTSLGTYAPSSSPTELPSASPSLAPTMLVGPSVSPAFPATEIVITWRLYNQSVYEYGDLAHANSLCEDGACAGASLVLLCYSGGYDLLDFPANNGFSDALPVVGTNVTFFGLFGALNLTFAYANWSAFLESNTTNEMVTGCDASYTLGLNCDDWTSSAAMVTDSFFTAPCTIPAITYCACVPP